MHYYIISEPQMSLSEGLENIQMPPFLIDENSGSIILNFDPQREMKGYFDFYVGLIRNIYIFFNYHILREYFLGFLMS